MINLEIFFTKIIYSINSKNLAVFCGAGISRNSGLPIVSQFLHYLLGKFDVLNEDIHYLLDKNNPKLPFEVFIKTFLRHSQHEHIYEIYRKGLPNANHLFIAKLARADKIKTIVTTNFDKLIEKAFDDEGLIEGEDYDLIYTEEDFKKIDLKSNKIRIIKIHGSIDNKRSMAITINQVASRQLTLTRQKILKYLFSEGEHDTVLVLGYSCSDAFDLTPIIESIKHNKIVYFLQHSSENKIENIGVKTYNNPFLNFHKSLRMFFDTDIFVKKIWKTTLHAKYKFIEGVTDWKANLDDWYAETLRCYSNAIFYIILGELYSLVTEYHIAERYYGIAREKNRKIGNDKIDEIIHGNLGNVYHAQKKYFKSLYSYNYALKLAVGQRSKKGESSWLGGIGNVFFSKKKYKKAKKYYMKALTTLANTNDMENQGRWYGSIGNIYYMTKEYKEAIKHYEGAINFSRYIGDIQSECAWLGNIGNALMGLGNEEDARKFYTKAFEKSILIGDKNNQGLWSKKLKQIDEGTKIPRDK
jgi:tetratricopeptide (TPR) repeat protein